MNELSEVVKAGGETDRMDMLSVVQDPGGTGETDGMNELSEIEDHGGETDRMNAPSEVQEPGAIGETDGRGELSEDVKAGGVTYSMDALLDALLVVGDIGNSGKAGWMEAPLGRKRSQAKAECRRLGPSCAGFWLECFFEL